jgi:hypothetical protein
MEEDAGKSRHEGFSDLIKDLPISIEQRAAH